MHSYRLTLLHIIYTSLNLPCICWQMLKRCIYSRYCIFLFWTLALQLDNDHSLPSFLPYPFQYFNGYIQRNLPQENVRIITVFELSSWSIRNHRPKSYSNSAWEILMIPCPYKMLAPDKFNPSFESRFCIFLFRISFERVEEWTPSPLTLYVL